MTKIFVVEDDQLLQGLYKLIFKEVGDEIIATASNGEEAVEKYKTFSEKPDLIIMDYRMPLKNGIDAMIEILRIQESQKILFASADITIKNQALLKGAVGFIEKPFKLKIFMDLMKEISK